MEAITTLFDSLSEYFSTMDWEALIADFSVIVEGIDFTVIVDTFNSLIDTISSLFA